MVRNTMCAVRVLSLIFGSCVLMTGCSRTSDAEVPLARGAERPADDHPTYSLGYTSHRTDLPGYYANQVTSRAFVVKGDGSGATELAPELVTKPHQHTGFGG